MKCVWIGIVMTSAALAGCQRDSTAPAGPPRNDPRAMAGASGAAATKEEVNAGRSIAMQGSPGAAACAGCHGESGEGNAQTGFPRLAGLGRPYIEHQLNSYADGTRANPVMTPIAGALSAQQRAAVAAFYSTVGSATAAASASPANAPDLVARGDDPRGIPACVNCHGPQGAGDGGANPFLAGQNASYLADTLSAWKDGSRHNDASGRMPAIAKALTDAEVDAIATYYASLPPPRGRL